MVSSLGLVRTSKVRAYTFRHLHCIRSLTIHTSSGREGGDGGDGRIEGGGKLGS